MKRIFFTFIIACSTGLLTLPLDHSLRAQESSVQAITQRDGAMVQSSISSNYFALEEQGPRARKHHHSHSDSFHIGPTGPTGPQGDTGLTGPTGGAGVSSAYGSFFTEERSTVLAGASIPFTSKSFASGSITLQPAGGIQLTQSGDYLISFGASSTSGSAQIALTLDGIVIPGTNVSLPLAPINQLTTVSTIVRVTIPPSPSSLLKVINNGSSPFTLGTDLGFDITAFITVEAVNN